MVVSIISCCAVWKELLSSVILLEGDQECCTPHLTHLLLQAEEAMGRVSWPAPLPPPGPCCWRFLLSPAYLLDGVVEEKVWGVTEAALL